MKRKSVIQTLFEQLCNYGGIAATRSEIYDHVIACAASKNAPMSSAHKCADRAAWSYPQIKSPAECATGLTFKQAELRGMV